MKSKTMAVTMTTMRRLTMLDRKVGESVGHVLGVIDRGLEIVEHLFLAQQDARRDLRLVAEQAPDGFAIDRVTLLLEFAQHATGVDQRRVRVGAQVGESV